MKVAYPAMAPRMIVDDDGQPRPHRLRVGVQDQQVELCMVSLPDRIRSVRPMSMDQLEAIAIGCGAIMGQSDKARIETPNDGMHGGIGRHPPVLRFDQRPKSPANGRCG